MESRDVWCSSRGNQNGGNALEKTLQGCSRGCGGIGIEHNHRRNLAGGNGAPSIIGCFHSKSFDAALAQFSTQARAELPFFGDDKYDWHPLGKV